MDGIIKYMSGQIDLLTIIFWRFMLASVFVTIPYILIRRSMPPLDALRFHALRGLVHIIAASLFFFALTKITLVETTILGFTATFFLLFIARIVLDEAIEPKAALAVCIGFVGVVVVLSGDGFSFALTNDRIIGFGCVLVSACLYAFSVVLLRKRAMKDGLFLIAVLSNVFPALFIMPVALIFGEPAALEDFLILPIIAAFGMLIWVLMTYAYANSEAQLLAPTEYTALIWSALIGWFFFQEVPNSGIWWGGGLIVLACLIVVWVHRDNKKTA